jgi:DNA-directed RNA polymerase I and III subunit RPAC1
VYSSALEWDPRGDQREVFAQDPPRPVHSDILLAKLRPGQVRPRPTLRCG